jgi:Rps23 Pro-64 3,4-dihydroxylase Tpa1-like proline 4-hydroxylase
VTDTFMPRWNSLSLFRVPALHAVSLVAPWAGAERLAITGWLLARPA